MKLRGITVTLVDKRKIGEDEFGAPIYDKTEDKVENVLVAPATTDDIPNDFDFSGKKAVYKIAIPKNDKHEWQDKQVKFFGSTWQVVGFPQRGIDDMLPLDWNDVWMVELYG